MTDENVMGSPLERSSSGARKSDRRSILPARRSRLVTFRVSDDEYEDLSRSCILHGARSLSDFARASVLQNVQASRSPATTLRGDLVTISKKLSDLDTLLTDVHKNIRKMLGPAQPRRKDYSINQ